jgi:hypothetical protein
MQRGMVRALSFNQRQFVMRSLLVAAPMALWLLASPAWGIDIFDRHTSYWVKQAAQQHAAVESLSSGQAAELRALSRDILSPMVVVQTDQGNWAKALLGWGLRKAQPAPVPVLFIERFVTYDRDRGDVTVAHGRNVMLFPGFEFDFDIGQVVPRDLGGDVAFNDQRLLVPIAAARLHPVNGSVVPGADEGGEPDPNDHAGVLPRDFSGTWRVQADGRWAGTWSLTVDDEGTVQGQYLSDETQSTYPVEGRVSAGGVPHRVALTVKFAAADQVYDLYLWTRDKAAMAGTTTLQEHTFGAYAVRVRDAKPARPPAPDAPPDPGTSR